MDKFWLVWRVGGPEPVHKHMSESTAEREAERLARTNPGEKFVVLEAVRWCERSEVRWHDLSDDVPF